MGKKKVSLEQYCDFVESMVSDESSKDFASKLGTAGLGLAGEAGEVADIIKKILFQGKELDENVRRGLISEVGDVLWYVAFTCRCVLDVPMQEVFEQNIIKLKERYKEGKFTVAEFQKKEKKKSKKKI